MGSLTGIEIIIILFALAVYILIVFLIIKYAVASAIASTFPKPNDNKVHEALRLNNRLLIQQLLNQGISYKRIEQLENLSEPAFENYRLTV